MLIINNNEEQVNLIQNYTTLTGGQFKKMLTPLLYKTIFLYFALVSVAICERCSCRKRLFLGGPD